jgi:succinate-semialdehyde dehydrogenase / glutarate-semialdehyde dehydrogenase
MLQKVGLPPLADGALLKTDSFIDGQWCAADSGSRFAIHNPADGLKLADVANAGPADAVRAIEAAQRAMPAWRTRTAKSARACFASGTNSSSQTRTTWRS